MNPASKDIVTLLDGDTSLGLTDGTDLFYSRLPESPDDCVAVFDNPGRPPMTTLKKATSNYFYSSITVCVRNTDYGIAWAQINDIIIYLHAISHEVVGTTYYSLIKAMSDPQVLNWDGNDRRVTLMVNFSIQRRDN